MTSLVNIEFGPVGCKMGSVRMAEPAGLLFAGCPSTQPPNERYPANDLHSQFGLHARADVCRDARASRHCVINGPLCCNRSQGWLIRATGQYLIWHLPPTSRSTESKTVPDWQRGWTIVETSLSLEGRRVFGGIK